MTFNVQSTYTRQRYDHLERTHCQLGINEIGIINGDVCLKIGVLVNDCQPVKDSGEGGGGGLMLRKVAGVCGSSWCSWSESGCGESGFMVGGGGCLWI